MTCPYCGAALASGARLCQACGRLIAPGHTGSGPGSAPAAPIQTGQTGPGTPRPIYQPAPSAYTSDPYGPFFDLGSLSPETTAAYRQHRFRATFSVLLLVLVHFLTLGMASPFLVARKYSFLPVIRKDDFSAAKAAGFLFIPFFGLYWVFVLCRRIVDRLTLQARLWSLPDAPSRGLATALSICWVLTAIPYVGLVFWLPFHFALWPIYLVQIQRLCNRLALEAAPPDARSAMLRLEGATRMRWIGWIILAPGLASVATALIVAALAPARPLMETIVGSVLIVLIASGGGVLLYLGERTSRAVQEGLASTAPQILAGYLRIDKNAAWTVAWIAGPLACYFLLIGAVALLALVPEVPSGEGPALVVLGGVIGVGAAYAAMRALQLKRQIAWLEGMPASDDPGAASW